MELSTAALLYDHPSLRHDIFADCTAHPGHQIPADIGIERRALSTLSPRIWTTWMGRNLVESTEKPGALECGKVRKGTMGRSWQDGKGVAQLAVVELLKGRGRWFGIRCRRACSRPQYARWPHPPPPPLADNLLELFRGGNLAGARSSWASRVTPPPVASRFLLPWLSLDGAIRFWGDSHTGESYVNSSRSLSTNPLLRHSCRQSLRRTWE